MCSNFFLVGASYWIILVHWNNISFWFWNDANSSTYVHLATRLPPKKWIGDCGIRRIKMMTLPTVLLRTVNITRLSVTSFPCRYCFNVIISFCIVTRLLFRLVILLFYERMYLLYHCNSKEKRKSFISAILRTRKCTTSHGQACHGEDEHHVICST